MNRDDIIRIAEQAGIFPWVKHEWSEDRFIHTDEGLDGDLSCLIQFAALVAAEEREACARVCEELAGREGWEVHECADEIRARGEPQERTPDYLEKCPNCNGPADNGFDRSWPDPNPYYCTKCMKAMEY